MTTWSPHHFWGLRHYHLKSTQVLHSIGGNAMCLRAALAGLCAAISCTDPKKFKLNWSNVQCIVSRLIAKFKICKKCLSETDVSHFRSGSMYESIFKPFAEIFLPKFRTYMDTVVQAQAYHDVITDCILILFRDMIQDIQVKQVSPFRSNRLEPTCFGNRGATTWFETEPNGLKQNHRFDWASIMPLRRWDSDESLDMGLRRYDPTSPESGETLFCILKLRDLEIINNHLNDLMVIMWLCLLPNCPYWARSLPGQGMNLPPLLTRAQVIPVRVTMMIQIILLLPLVLHMWTWPSKDYSHCIAQNLLKIHHHMQKLVDRKGGWLELWTIQFANVNVTFPWEFFSKLLWPFGYWPNQHKMLYYGAFSMKPELTRRNCGSLQVGLFDKHILILLFRDGEWFQVQ